jgi:hypothetical protein
MNSGSAAAAAEASYRAATCLQTGSGAPKDAQQALRCYVIAAAAGHGAARQALCEDFRVEAHLEAAARLEQVHEMACRELARPGDEGWLSWLASVERHRFFADDIALGDRNQQLQRLSGCITAEGTTGAAAAPPSAALVWLLVDLVDAHGCGGLVQAGGPALVQWIASPAVPLSLQAAACTLLVVLAEHEDPAPAPPPRAAAAANAHVWRDAAVALVLQLERDGSDDRCGDAEEIFVPALECLGAPCVLVHADPHRLAAALKRAMQYPGRVLEMACRCVDSAVASGDPAHGRALVEVAIELDLFEAVEKHRPSADATQQETDEANQDTLVVVFTALRTLLGTGSLDGRLACAAESLIGNSIRISLRATNHPVCQEAYQLLLQTIARPWPVFESSLANHVAAAVLSVTQWTDAAPSSSGPIITLLKAFVAWLPRTDWDMIPLCLATAQSIEKDHATVTACAEWCATVSPRVAEFSLAQLSQLCEFIVPRSPAWLDCQTHPQAAASVVILCVFVISAICPSS